MNAAAGVIPGQPFRPPQQRRVSGDVSPGAGLNARDGVDVRGLGWRLIVPALGAGTVVRFEVFGRSRWWRGALSTWAAVSGAGVSGGGDSGEVARQRPATGR